MNINLLLFRKLSFKKYTVSILMFMAICVFTNQAISQCVGGNAIHANTVGSTQFGQSITANCTGLLSNFTYQTTDGNGNAMTLVVRTGEGCAGSILATVNFTQTLGVNSITFSPKIAVTNGQLYSFIITGNHTNIKTHGSSAYSTGALLWTPACQIFGRVNSWDMVFNYTIDSDLPEINVKGNNVSITDGDVMPSLTDSTDFGNQGICTGTLVRTYTIQNTGAGTINVSAIATSGGQSTEFVIGGISLPAAISAGTSKTFTVTFDPTALGIRSTTLNITNNDADENPYNFTIQGTGDVSTSPILNVSDGMYYCTLSEAISASNTNDGEEIRVPAGTY